MQSDHSENLEASTAAAADTRLDTAELRRRIAQADSALADEFWSGADIDELVAERARFIDAFLAEIWQHWFEHNDNLALLAVGGYGRGELHPHSDIDLLILAKRPGAVQDGTTALVGLRGGHGGTDFLDRFADFGPVVLLGRVGEQAQRVEQGA